MRSGILFVISAPSGRRKTTLCERLQKTSQFLYSISCTTRAPRRNEREGKDYLFVSESVFKERIRQGYFLEYAQVHGCFYGTPIQSIKETLAKGLDMLLDIDVQGAEQIRNHQDPSIRSALADVFLMTRSFHELEQRLRKRGTDEEATIRKRLAVARKEIAHWKKYAYVILSSRPEDDERKFQAIVDAERYRSARLTLDKF